MNFVLNGEKDNSEVTFDNDKNTPTIGYHLRTAGRPSKYNKEYSYLAFQFAQAGLRQCDCARLMEVSLSTFKNWLKHNDAFAFEWKRGCIIADAEVARALFKLAVGFEEKTIRIVHMDDGTYIIKKYRIYPPNLRACKMWLRNRQPQLWK